MMNRLNSIAPIMQYPQSENNNWSLPCEPEAIPALQNWLEQLSANIQTDDNIYSQIKQENAMLTTPSFDQNTLLTPPTHEKTQCYSPLSEQDQVHLLLNDDYDLYPKLDTSNMWASSSASTGLSPSFIPHQTSASESSAVHSPLPPPDNFESTTPQSEKSTKPQLWSPGYIHSPLYNTQHAKDTLSDSPTTTEQTESSMYFKSSLTRSMPVVPSIASSSKSSFDNKKEIMHMINVFSSSDDIKYKPKEKEMPTEDEKQTTFEEKVEDLNQQQEETPITGTVLPSSNTITELPTTTNEPEIKYPSLNEDDVTSNNNEEDSADQSLYPRSHIDEESESEYSEEDDYEEEEDVESPYANLAELVGQMKVEDEETLRKRHKLLIDQLLQAISRVA